MKISSFAAILKRVKQSEFMELKKVNRIISILIMMTNIYFIPLNIILMKESGGPMGFGLLCLPFLLSTNFLLIPAALTFEEKVNKSFALLVINGLGLAWNIFWLFIL